MGFIQIELQELDSIREELNSLKLENRDLKAKLSKLDEDRLYSDATQTAMNLFNETMSRVFKELGFDPELSYCGVDMIKLQNCLGKDFNKNDRLTVTVGATVANNFRKAFVVMGVKFDEN